MTYKYFWIIVSKLKTVSLHGIRTYGQRSTFYTTADSKYAAIVINLTFLFIKIWLLSSLIFEKLHAIIKELTI